MALVQEERLGGHNLNYADKCRKALAKKIGGLFDECEKEFYDTIAEKGLSEKLAHYVWDVLLRVQRGYSFNRSHTLAYSLVALQEMNLAYKFPLIFWNCACLITDSGGGEQPENEDEGIYMEEQEEVVDIYESEDFEEYEYEDAEDKKTKVKKKRKSTDYKKIATAIGKMRQAGIIIEPPNINTSSYTFTPNVEENKIIYGLSGILNVGEDVIKSIIENRPYSSPKDFVLKAKPKKQAMISLIKGGAFDSMMDRKLCMGWYIWNASEPKKNITLQNMASLIKYNLLPTNTDKERMAKRIYEFNRYLKSECKVDKEVYHLDERAINFLTEIDCLDLIYGDMFMSAKAWDNVYQKWMDVFRKWITNNKQDIMNNLNDKVFAENWNKYAKGTISAWEMEALCFYYHEHELAHVNSGKYGIVDFFSLPEEPLIDKSFTKGGKTINMFKLSKICGTCIAKDKNKGTITLLTEKGVVNIKMHKEVFSIYDRQISEQQPDKTKKVIEKGWFTRGNRLLIQGFRSGDNFITKKYAHSSMQHTVMKINDIDFNGEIVLQSERTSLGKTN